MSIYTHQDSNIRKTWVLMALFFGVVIGIGWFFSYLYDSQAILFFAVIFSVLMNVGAYWFSDKIVLSMYKAQLITREMRNSPQLGAQYADLWNVVENLSITAGLPMPKLYVINDAQPNAFATGRNKDHSAVAVTTGLLQILNRTELEGVIAHELAHIGNRDMLISTVVVVLVGFITIISDIFLRSLWFSGHGGRSNDRGGNIGGVLMLIGIVLAILSPVVATIIRLAISRKREFLADASGALLTRYPEGLASALEKISSAGVNRPMTRANNATAHLFISSPFGLAAHAHAHTTGGGKASFLSKLFMTHPPVEERVKALRSE